MTDMKELEKLLDEYDQSCRFACEDLLRIHTAAGTADLDEIVRLLEAANKLPTTADGVLVVPGAELFTLATNEAGSGIVPTEFSVVFVGQGIVRGTLRGYRIQHGAERFPRECYSTREAAEAAMGGES